MMSFSCHMLITGSRELSWVWCCSVRSQT